MFPVRATTRAILPVVWRTPYRHAGQSYRLTPGDAMLFDSAALHGPETLVSKPMTYLSIIIQGRRLD